jgi:hypothetical protein
MGTQYFQPKAPKQFQSSSINLEARAGSAGGYAARSASGGRQKDIAAAKALYAASKLKPTGVKVKGKKV